MKKHVREYIIGVVNTMISEKYPFSFTFSESKMEQWNVLIKNGICIKDEVRKTLECIEKKDNYPFYWYARGSSTEDSFYYAKNVRTYNFVHCAWCGAVYSKPDGHKSCCCKEHFDLQMDRRNGRLSLSRLQYNPRNPVQYAERHGISLNEAIEIVEKINKETTHRRPEYWLNKGYSEEAIQKVSEKQSNNSKRCVSYYINRGASEEEAINHVSSYQSEESVKRFIKYTKDELRYFSPFCKEYWINKGYTEEDAVEYVQYVSRKGLDAINEKYTAEEKLLYNCNFPDYWMKKYPETWEEEYLKHKEKMYKRNSANRSAIADEFVENFAKLFDGDKVYYKETEFGMMVSTKNYIKIDFVNLTKLFCVEFLGNYWHANPNIYTEDQVIKFPKGIQKTARSIWEADQTRFDLIRQRGFRVYSVWEDDYRNSPETCIKNLFKEIMDEDS